MQNPPTYPNDDIARASARAAVPAYPRVPIAAVVPDSPADDAGFEPGCFITSVDGQPVRDVIDWRWLSGDESITVGYIDLDGDAGEVELWRDAGEDWGFEFDGLVFDDVRQCRNACTFCFMRQLPSGMRASLSLRDDDFRLSFLVGTFVTCTNLTPEDEARIIGQRISPLRVSLQATDADVRRLMIGKHAAHGLAALERLLDAGIQFHAQIVLVPGQNDGDELVRTLTWAYERPGILGVGIVPLGYTRFQDAFDHSFNDARAARQVLDAVAPLQARAQAERNTPWVFAADEFYRNAFRDNLLENLPPTSFYGDFSMFEDGIGIIRSTIDDWTRAEESGLIAHCATALRSRATVARMIAGCAQREFLDPLIARANIADVFQPLYVENAFFGGNVDVTGLLTGEDIVNAVKREVQGFPQGDGDEGLSEAARSVGATFGEESKNALAKPTQGCPREAGSRPRETFEGCEPGDRGRLCPRMSEPRSGEFADTPQPDGERLARGSRAGGSRLPGDNRGMDPIFLIPRVIFNDDALTLDDMLLEDMEKAAGVPLRVVSLSPLEYFKEIAAIAADRP